LKIDPKNIDAWTDRGFSLYKVRKYKDALKCYEKALEFEPENEYIRKLKEDCQDML